MTDRDDFIELAVELLNDTATDLNDVTFSSITTGVFDPLTGTNTDTTTDITLKAFFDKNLKLRENQEDLQESETWVVLSSSDLLGTIPTNNDFVVDSEGTKWVIFEEEHDVYRAAYFCKARLSNN